MPSEEEVEAAAKVIAATALIDRPKLPVVCWYGLARSVLEAAERERHAERIRNCQHPNRTYRGAISSDGSGYSEWYCPACGKTERSETPPRAATPFGIADLPQNVVT